MFKSISQIGFNRKVQLNIWWLNGKCEDFKLWKFTSDQCRGWQQSWQNTVEHLCKLKQMKIRLGDITALDTFRFDRQHIGLANKHNYLSEVIPLISCTSQLNNLIDSDCLSEQYFFPNPRTYISNFFSQGLGYFLSTIFTLPTSRVRARKWDTIIK